MINFKFYSHFLRTFFFLSTNFYYEVDEKIMSLYNDRRHFNSVGYQLYMAENVWVHLVY